MSAYKEEEYLMLSGIQHFAFCKRQWALIQIENVWQENYHTAIGNILHERVHDSTNFEKRGNIIISRGMPIFSASLGIRGECDVVEFVKDSGGVKIHGRDGKYVPYPVEYKKGSPKKNEVDILQLAAQVMCLEEMFLTNIPYGYLYYGQTRHREKIEITKEIREKVSAMFCEMHMLFKRGHTPKVNPSKSCNSCSLVNLCLPVLCKNKSAKDYIENMLNEE
ncbi:MAG: CRISPR-associated protein Cas4 [Clostridiaceae bacterium]|nr:CRISPR-associated protein Cas4 [Clostridiaceae bacterium]